MALQQGRQSVDNFHDNVEIGSAMSGEIGSTPAFGSSEPQDDRGALNDTSKGR
jgi:hypothetical protein